MPIFVDHAGMNTLINQELDLSTNTLNTGSNRISTGEVLDRALQNYYTTTAPFAGLSSEYTNSSYESYLDGSLGLSLSVWINLSSSNNGLHRTVFLSSQYTGASSGDHDLQLYFRGDSLYFFVADSNGDTATWNFSVTETDFNDTWKHIYLNWNGNLGGSPVAGDVRVWVDNSELGSPSITDDNLGDTSNEIIVRYISIMDSHILTNTLYEMAGKMQNFTLYGRNSTTRSATLYNSGVASTDLADIPDHSDVVAHFYLGNETAFDSQSVPSSIGATEVEPVLGTVTGSTYKGRLKQGANSVVNLVEGQRGTYVTASGELATGHVGRVSEPNTLAALSTHRNGPYGYSSWQQLRVSQNPLSRHHRSSNTMTFVTSPGVVRNVSSDGLLRVRDRYSSILSYTEPAVAQKAYPLVWNVGRHFKDEDGNVDMENPQRFSLVSSYGNQQIAFANEKVNKLHKFDPDEEQTEYIAIKDMYLENGLNKQDSPLTHWEFIQYRETVFPKATQQYVSQSRTRPAFTSFYRHNRTDRNIDQPTDGTGRFSFPNVSSFQRSTWPLDVEDDFLTKDLLAITPFNSYSPFQVRGILTSINTTYYELSLNILSDITSSEKDRVQASVDVYDGIFAPYPIYSRRISLSETASVSNPSGMLIDTTGSANFLVPFRGNSLWEAGSKREVRNSDGTYTSSPKEPFYDTYESYVEDVRKFGKNYSIIPEFRMSTQLEDFKRTDGEIELDMFEVTGGISGSDNSSKSNFYEIYSNTDFMKNFEIIADDHKDFTNGKVLSLRCKAIKKFLPYEGFYPCQRTVDLAERFHSSFKNNIKLYNDSGVEIDGFNYGRQFVMTPLFAPGVLFNTIKSGVAVDYPIITGSLESTSSLTATGLIGGLSFDKRIPFESLVNPAKYLSDYKLASNEPHPSGNVSASAEWDGQGDEFYSMMANNFLAESINFFLPNGQLSSVVSKKQKDIRLVSGSVYGMRVKMRRTMDGTRGSVYHFDSASVPYVPPQDIIKTGSSAVRENFTMYSRPSAFGPPSFGQTYFSHAAGPFLFDEDRFVSSAAGTGYEYHTRDSRTGYNFPFTPPYYHGEGWCQITFTASSDSMTIKEIQAASNYTYTRFDYTHIESSGALGIGIQARSGPQSLDYIDRNAVQLSASLNINGIGTIKKRGTGGSAGSLVVDSGLEEDNRWVIQTKFETPMLNFNHISGSDHLTLPNQGSGSVPRGMWHQYGRIPEEGEGVILQVGPIPDNYQFQVMGETTPMEDMSEALGFSGTGTKLGRLAQRKEISEAVVAVPFIEESGRKKFFTLDKPKIDTYKLGLTAENEDAYRKLTNGEPSEQIGRSVLNQIEKMKKYIFPPSFDFINFDTNKVTPVAMYIFEFSHVLTQTDLQDIWQNLPPTIGTEMEVAEVAITHPLLKKELLGPGGEGGTNTIEIPDKLKWMVFKVKQRASNNYFKKTVLRNSEINIEVDSGNVTQDEFGQTSTIQYNWPYDFFSLVEMVRIDAEVEMGNADFSNYTDNIPNWNPVQAEPEKIEYVVGGLEQDPIPEVEPPEPAEPEAPSNIGYGYEPVIRFDLENANSEGLFDVPSNIPDADKTYYLTFKGRFTVEANKDPLEVWANLNTRTMQVLINDVGLDIDNVSSQSVQGLRSWTQNWYNTDASFQQKKQSAQAGASSAQSLNNQTMRSNIERYFKRQHGIVYGSTLGSLNRKHKKANEEANRKTRNNFRDQVPDINQFTGGSTRVDFAGSYSWSFTHPPSIRD